MLSLVLRKPGKGKRKIRFSIRRPFAGISQASTCWGQASPSMSGEKSKVLDNRKTGTFVKVSPTCHPILTLALHRKRRTSPFSLGAPHMMLDRLRLRALCFVAVAGLTLISVACQTSEVTQQVSCDGDGCPGHAHVCHNPTVHALAKDLDHLEGHIERYGSV